MSKKLIAGAGVVASFAIALAPLATYAAYDSGRTVASDTHTDTFNINVQPTCAFGSNDGPIVGVSHNSDGTGAYDGVATWTLSPAANAADRNIGTTPDNDNGTAHTSNDTASYSIEAGTTKSGFAQTTLTVYCNDSTAAKYTLKVQMAELEETGGQKIPARATYSATASGYAIDSVSKTQGNGAINTTTFPANTKKAYTSATTMATSSTGTNASGDIYVVDYGIGVKTTQKAGTYTGNVVYTLFQGLETE